MSGGQPAKVLFREVNRNVKLLKKFKAGLNSCGIRATFTSPEDLRRCVAEGLHDWQQRQATTVSVGPATVSPTKSPVPAEYIKWLLARCGEVELMGLELQHGSGVRLNHVSSNAGWRIRSIRASTGRA